MPTQNAHQRFVVPSSLSVFFLTRIPALLVCWRSGYLPGEDYGYLPFFFGLAVVYLALGVAWMIVCMAYIKVRLASLGETRQLGTCVLVGLDPTS